MSLQSTIEYDWRYILQQVTKSSCQLFNQEGGSKKVLCLSNIRGFTGRTVQKQLLGGSGHVPWAADEETMEELYKLL